MSLRSLFLRLTLAFRALPLALQPCFKPLLVIRLLFGIFVTSFALQFIVWAEMLFLHLVRGYHTVTILCLTPLHPGINEMWIADIYCSVLHYKVLYSRSVICFRWFHFSQTNRPSLISKKSLSELLKQFNSKAHIYTELHKAHRRAGLQMAEREVSSEMRLNLKMWSVSDCCRGSDRV